MRIKVGYSEITTDRIIAIANAIMTAAQAAARHVDPILIMSELSAVEPLLREIENLSLFEITKADRVVVDTTARALIAYHFQRGRIA